MIQVHNSISRGTVVKAVPWLGADDTAELPGQVIKQFRFVPNPMRIAEEGAKGLQVTVELHGRAITVHKNPCSLRVWLTQDGIEMPGANQIYSGVCLNLLTTIDMKASTELRIPRPVLFEARASYLDGGLPVNSALIPTARLIVSYKEWVPF